MYRDRYGLELTTESGAARDAYVEGVDRMLAASPFVEDKLEEAIAADPGFALAVVALARQHQLRGRGKEARALIERAGPLASSASERERSHVEIFTNLLSGKIPLALEQTRAHLERYPLDAFVLDPACGVFGLIGFSGRKAREPEQLALLEPLVDAYGDDWWFHSAYAFALVEVGQWDRGRALIERSLEQRPRNAVAAHIKAHALYEAGENSPALAYLSDWLPEYDPDGLMHCHLWWHYCLLQVAAGNAEEAWRAYDRQCAPGVSKSPAINVVTDGAALLWRAELAGEPRSRARWRAVRECYERAFGRPLVFVDAHAGLAYAALGEIEALERYITEAEERGKAGRLPAGTLGAELTRAYRAFVAGRYHETVRILEPIMEEVVRIGGSRAQRDLVTNTLLAAYLRDGRQEAGRAFLESIHDRRPVRPVAGLA